MWRGGSRATRTSGVRDTALVNRSTARVGFDLNLGPQSISSSAAAAKTAPSLKMQPLTEERGLFRVQTFKCSWHLKFRRLDVEGGAIFSPEDGGFKKG